MRLAARDADAPDPYVVPPSQQFEGNDGAWSTFQISVGTPGQGFRVLPSTKGGFTCVIAPEGCLANLDPEDCHDLRGIDVFKSSPNVGFQVGESKTWSTIGQYEVDLEKALNFTAGGFFGFDQVSLGPAADNEASVSLEKQVVASIADPTYFLGLLPLGQAQQSLSSLSNSIDSFLYQLRNNTKIPSLSYAYTAGAKYRLKSVFGSLILGGYDATRFKPTPNDFSFAFSNDSSKLLTVGVQSILATNTLAGTYSLTSGAHFSVIDSTVPHLWLPEDVCLEFEAAFGLTYDPETDLYLVNDTARELLLSRNPSITIKLVSSLENTETEYTNIVLPYAALDLQASYPYYTNATNYFPIRQAHSDTQYTLGRTLLQEAYLIVDYERANFTVAQAVFPDPLSAPSIHTITSANTPSESSPSVSTGAIIGIVIGAIAIILLLLLLFFLHLRKRRAKSSPRYELAGKHAPSDPALTSSPYTTSTPTAQAKSPAPQELAGTPLTELASPDLSSHHQDRKTVLNVTNTPQELHAESSGPITPRWQEVHAPPPPPEYHTHDPRITPTPTTDEKYNPESTLNPPPVSHEGSRIPVTPRWQEVHVEPQMRGGEWEYAYSQSGFEGVEPVDPFATPGVSPLTPRFGGR